MARLTRTRSVLGGLLAAGALTLGACGSGGGSDAASDGDGPATTLDTRNVSGTIDVASGRSYGVEAAFAEFTKRTGVQVRFTTGKDPELRERLAAEGANSPVDVFMAVDAANLDLAARDGLLRSVESPTLDAEVPSEFRDEDDRWFGLSRRIRTIAYSTERVQPGELAGYEALGDDEWKGKLCLRTSSHPYNQSLVADLSATLGAEKTEQIVDGWMANDPKIVDSDTEAVEQIAAGACDVAVVNTYYVARLQEQKPGFPVAVHWADDGDRGPHTNVSGAGVTKSSDNPAAALALIEFLAGAGQRLFVDGNLEYPVNPKTEPHPRLASWGPIAPAPSTDAVREYGERQRDAVMLLDRAGYR